MPTLVKPYGGTGMGEDLFGLGGIADAFFGPKASQSALLREKFKEQQRQNIGVEDLATLLQNPNADPGAQAAAALRGGTSYKELGGLNLYGVAGRNTNPLDPRVVTAQTQAQVPFASTATGDLAHRTNAQTIATMQADKAAANNAAIDARSLVPVRGPDGSLTYVQKSLAVGQQAPIPFDQARGDLLQRNFGNLDTLNPFQRGAIGADANMANWFVRDPQTGKILSEGRTPDGKVDAATGLPLHPSAVTQQSSNPGGANAFTQPATELGKGELKDRREAVLNADAVLDIGTRVKDIIKRNPTAIGAAGNIRLMGQEGADLANSLNTMFGGGKENGYSLAVNQARNALQAKLGPGALQLMPELFDSDLNSVRTMNGMLIYKAAAALGQSGRDASDKDIAIIKGFTGDPASWFQGPNTYNDKVSTLMQIVARQRDADHKLLQPGASIGPRSITVQGVPDVPGAAAPAATAAPAGANPVVDDLLRKYGAAP